MTKIIRKNRPPGINTVTVEKDGPLYLLGPHAICNASGSIARVCEKSALCRCGATKTPPFCDASHARIAFKAD